MSERLARAGRSREAKLRNSAESAPGPQQSPTWLRPRPAIEPVRRSVVQDAERFLRAQGSGEHRPARVGRRGEHAGERLAPAGNNVDSSVRSSSAINVGRIRRRCRRSTVAGLRRRGSLTRFLRMVVSLSRVEQPLVK